MTAIASTAVSVARASKLSRSATQFNVSGSPAARVGVVEVRLELRFIGIIISTSSQESVTLSTQRVQRLYSRASYLQHVPNPKLFWAVLCISFCHVFLDCVRDIIRLTSDRLRVQGTEPAFYGSTFHCPRQRPWSLASGFRQPTSLIGFSLPS